MPHIVTRLRRIRESAGLQRHELATFAGMSPASIYRLEDPQGVPDMKVSTVVTLCSVLECNPGDLIPELKERKSRG